MHSIQLPLFALLASLACTTLADSPYVVHGLHTDLTMDEAIQVGNQLGGLCEEAAPRRKVGGRSAMCRFQQACPPGTRDCPSTNATALEVGGQPIHSIEIEAHGEGIAVSNISIFFAGDHLLAIDAVKALFGEPAIDTAIGAVESWSDSRRLLWQKGQDRASLIDNPQLILLVKEPGK